MLKIQFLLMFLCAEIFLIHSYTIHHLPRPFWAELEGEPNDELLSKFLSTEPLLNEGNTPMSSSAIALFDQADGHPGGLQKRGRQCLWKVCSWALDKRSLRSPGSATSNSVDALSKLLY